MSLGLCCQWLEPSTKGLKNTLISRSLQLSRYRKGLYSSEKIHDTYLANVTNLVEIFPKIVSSGIKCFRLSSSLFPLYDLVDRSLWDNPKILDKLKKVGDLAQLNHIRVTMHPGQFCVLSSDSQETLKNSVKEIEMHAWVLDQMGLDQCPLYAINIHGGKGNAEDNLIEGIKQLNASARNRLTLENCEFAYSISHLLYVHQQTKVPLVFDSHHHEFNMGGLSGSAAMEAAISTWLPSIKPLTHLSNSKEEYLTYDAPITRLREHSDK
ncbi:hypothetical protein C4588_08015, partial [Candidatus Parcubacteria bacterium]